MSFQKFQALGEAPIQSTNQFSDKRAASWGKRRYLWSKRALDLSFSALALPVICGATLSLLILNPIGNPGPLFFRQQRMGKDGTSFTMWKFRTMRETPEALRSHDAPLEVDRITPIGRFLRLTRIDELPNVVNIIAGDMTLVGPRPDAFSHAIAYIGEVPEYVLRYRVKPGLTGIAQVRGGYADTNFAVKRKARHDRFYVENASLRLDAYILRRTVKVVLFGLGAK